MNINIIFWFRSFISKRISRSRHFYFLTNSLSCKRGKLGLWHHNAFCVSICVLLSKTLKIKIYRTIILPVVLYGCETWSLTLREERRRRVFENRVLRRVFGPKRDEVAGEWRKLHNEELRDIYSLPNIVWVVKSRRMRGRGMWRVWGRGEVCTGF